jgi:hypothetical protein
VRLVTVFALVAELSSSRPSTDVDWTEEYNVNDLGFAVGAVSKSSSYDGLTDEEAEELKKELDAVAARRLSFGFSVNVKATKSAGRKAGSWPKVPSFDVVKKSPARAGARAAGSRPAPRRSR